MKKAAVTDVWRRWDFFGFFSKITEKSSKKMKKKAVLAKKIHFFFKKCPA